MGKKKGRWSQYQENNQTVLEALKERAEEKTTYLGHHLGIWSPAKRKHGVNAMKALCAQCGEHVIVMPRHCHSKAHQQVPAMKGDLLFQLCCVEGTVVK